MGKTSTKTVILGIVIAITFIAGIVATEFVYADHVSSLPSARIVQSLEVLFVDIGLIKTDVGIVKASSYVPFTEVITPFADGAQSCDTPTTIGRAFILDINSNTPFVVHNILLQTKGVDELSDFIGVNSIEVDGINRNTGSVDLTQTSGPLLPFIFDDIYIEILQGYVLSKTFDPVTGYPLLLGPTILTSEGTQTSPDIRVIIICGAQTSTNIDILTVKVSGWKLNGEVITLSLF